MKTDPKYIAERFLAAFDAVQSETGASDALMSVTLDDVSHKPPCVCIRRAMAVHMAVRDGDGRRVPIARIASCLGVSIDTVWGYIRQQETAA